MTEREITERYLDGYDRILAMVSATGRRLTRDGITSRRALGEQAAEADHVLCALAGAHLAATRTAWPGTADSADSALAAVQAGRRACQGPLTYTPPRGGSSAAPKETSKRSHQMLTLV